MIGVVIGYIYQECITGKNGSIFSPEMEDAWLFKKSKHTFFIYWPCKVVFIVSFFQALPLTQNIFLNKTGCKSVL